MTGEDCILHVDFRIRGEAADRILFPLSMRISAE